MSGTERNAPVEDFDHVVGHRFPGGRHTLAPHEAWLWDDAVGAVPDRTLAHPGIAYMVGLHGGGASIQDIMDVLGTDNDAGVMMAGLEFDVHEPLRPGATFDVEGEITSVVRKCGKRTGPFDLVGFEHRLTAVEDGVRSEAGPDVVVRHMWLVPRALEAKIDA
jgi:hypothetical protein